MRVLALYVAIVLLAIGLAPRSWAKASFGDGRYPSALIEVGTRDFVESHGSQTRTEPLRELSGAGPSFEAAGRRALHAGIAAALAFAAASVLLRRRALPLPWRLALVIPAAVSLVFTALFTRRLLAFRYLELGWSPYLCIAGAVIGSAAIVSARRRLT